MSKKKPEKERVSSSLECFWKGSFQASLSQKTCVGDQMCVYIPFQGL